jgi:hypothetical protein
MFEIFNKISQLLTNSKKKSKISTLDENLDFFYASNKMQARINCLIFFLRILLW